jgi:hypothetical protein
VIFLNSFAIVASIILFFVLFMKPEWSYYALTVISFATTSVIVAGSYPALDEMLLTVMSLGSIVTLVKNNFSHKVIRLSLQEKYKLFFIIYLLVNTTISSALDFNVSNLRFLLLFLNLSILLLVLPRIPQNKDKLSQICAAGIKINLYFWFAYWLLLKYLKIDWAQQQSVSWAGTAYAAIVPSVGLLLLLFIRNKEPEKKIEKSYLFFFSISVFTSVFYDSRVLNFAVILSATVISIKFRTIKNIVIMVSIFISSQFAANAIVFGEVSLNIRNINLVSNPSEYASSFSESLQFINNPRTSDLDRSTQIKCSTKLIVSDSRIFNTIFGYGQNSHKKIMLKCLPIDLQVLNKGGPVRPVGYAAYVIDFGLFGLFGLVTLLIVIAKELIHSKSGMYYFLILLLLMSFSLVTNYLEHVLVYQVLFFDLLKNLARHPGGTTVKANQS